ARFSFRPHPAPVAMDDALYERQAHAGAFKFLLAMQPLKHAEQPVAVFLVKTDAIVLHVAGHFAVLAPAANFDAWRRPRAREFDGVADEIGEDLAKHGRISRGRRQRL